MQDIMASDFSFSLIISAAIIMLDVGMNIGLKIWLSKNFDFSNFYNFYSLKSWITLKEFSLIQFKTS